MAVKKCPMVLWRMVTTVLLCLAYWGFDILYKMFEAPVIGSAAVDQLQDDKVAYGVAKAIGQGAIPSAVGWVLFFALLLIWGSFIISIVRYLNKKEEK